MKKTILALSVMFTLGSVSFFLSSCGEDDPCKDVECGVHGTCNTGTCDCEFGYELDPVNGRCDLISREKFKGTFAVFDTCSTTKTSTYTVVATDGATIVDLNITGFWKGAFKNAIKAKVDGSKITIARQEPDADKFFVEGSGTIKNGTITWTYKISDEGVTPFDIDNCRSKWTK
jgi:hypothetical protein